jgi:hypothetical protein
LSNACWKTINSATKESTFSLYDGCCQSIFTSARWKPLGLRDW